MRKTFLTSILLNLSVFQNEVFLSNSPGKYLIGRFLRLIPILFIIVTVSFFMMRFAPGGPFDSEKSLSPQVEKNVRKLYGFDKPLIVQYAKYIKNAASLDFGYSYTYLNEPVSKLIKESFKVSFLLGLFALVFALIVGMTAGIFSALNRGKFIDYFFFSFTIFGVSVPSIILGPLLVLVFGLWLKIFPVAGWGTLSHTILPAITLGAVYTSFIARLTREGFIETLSNDYVKTARALGMKEQKVIFKYVLRGSVLPLISYLGPAFAGIVTGSLIIEKIFQINGLGTHFVNSALNRDYSLALGTVIFYSAILLFINFLTDIFYVIVDPRITFEKQ